MSGRKQILVVVVTLLGSIVVTGGPAGSEERHRDQGRFRNKRSVSRPADKNVPTRFVAEAGGRIVVVSVTTGRVGKYLTADQGGSGAVEPALSPDGRTVWFSRRGGGKCAAHLASVPVEGGTERRLPGSGEAGPEQRPVPRPAHAQIAFSRTDCQEPSESLVVGDVAGLEGYGQTGFAPMEWSRDGKQLLAAAADDGAVHLLTVKKNGAIVGNDILDPADRSEGCRLKVVGFSPDDNDGYVAVRRCGQPGDDVRHSLVLLDKAGRHRKVILRLARGQNFVDRIAFDRTGHLILYSTMPSAGRDSSGDAKVTLWVWRDGKARRVIRDSPYRQPSWLP